MNNRNDRNRNRNDRNDRNENRGPWGYGVAPVGGDEDGKGGHWVRVGPVWMTEKGALRLTIEATPIEWNDPHTRRTVLIQEADNR